MGKVFIIDQGRCNGCHGCQIACKDEHVGNEWLPYQLPQPDTGHFWMRVEQTTHGQVPKVKVEYKPIMCQQCATCPLVEAYPDVVTRREDGLVCIDPVKAKGNKELLDLCPFGTVYWNAELEVPQKCDGCAHLVDAGEIPHCVDMCVTEALKFGDEEDFADEIAAATQLEGAADLGARVYYLNAPGLFIGGEIWDEQADEVLEGVRVVLVDADGSETVGATNDWGDFWFRKLAPGNYTVRIEPEGYAAPAPIAVTLDKSLNLGDFPLKKK